MNQPYQSNFEVWAWWSEKRLCYNVGLVVAGVAAFILYVILASLLIAPYDHDFEISLFTTFVQGFGYLIMIGIANIFYFLGPLFDKLFNKEGKEFFRSRLYTWLLFFCFITFFNSSYNRYWIFYYVSQVIVFVSKN